MRKQYSLNVMPDVFDFIFYAVYPSLCHILFQPSAVPHPSSRQIVMPLIAGVKLTLIFYHIIQIFF